MYNFKIFICVWLALIFFSICDARGGGRGGGGGRSGGRSSGRSSSGSRRGSFSSSSSSSRGYGSSHSSGGSGWFHGFFHSSPQYSYRPIFITRSSGSSGSHYTPKEEYSSTSSNDDTSSYAIGYTISRGLSGDFFSLFNMVRGISKYPDKIRNNETIQTTTPTPTTTTTTSTESPTTYEKNNFIYNYEELQKIFKHSFNNLNILETDYESQSTQPTPVYTTNEN